MLTIKQSLKVMKVFHSGIYVQIDKNTISLRTESEDVGGYLETTTKCPTTDVVTFYVPYEEIRHMEGLDFYKRVGSGMITVGDKDFPLFRINTPLKPITATRERVPEIANYDPRKLLILFRALKKIGGEFNLYQRGPDFSGLVFGKDFIGWIAPMV